MRTTSSILALLICCACSSPESAPLVSGDDWQMVLAADDPWEGRPADLECADGAVIIEDGLLEVTTTQCSWVTMTAPAVERTGKGWMLDLFVFHSTLTVPDRDDVVATMAVQLGDEIVWSHQVPVPSAAAFYREEIILESGISVGDPVYVHIDNHGSNAYTLGHLKVTR